jgi:hypothetical protein
MEGASYPERAARGARTQSLFRDVNERVREINEAFNAVLQLGDWICECADSGCDERIELSAAEYEEVRAKPTWFAVAPGDSHVFPEIEDVVARSDRFWTVAKRDLAAELAASVDPRRVGLTGQPR